MENNMVNNPSTEGKAPAMDATATPPASTTQTATRASAETAAAASLPENYCAGGSLTDAEGIIRPEYIGTSAEALAKALRPLTATAFNAAFLKNGKDLRKKKTAYAAQKNYVLSLSTQAKKLVYRKPPFSSLRRMRIYGAGWLGRRIRKAPASCRSGSPASVLSFTAYIRRQGPFTPAPTASRPPTSPIPNWSQTRRSS